MPTKQASTQNFISRPKVFYNQGLSQKLLLDVLCQLQTCMGQYIGVVFNFNSVGADSLKLWVDSFVRF